MKTIVLSIFLLCFIFNGQAFGQANFDAKEKEVYGRNKVKQQTQWSYDFVNGKPGSKGYISQKLLFDKSGNTIEETNFKADGSVTSVVTYTYDAKGNKTSFSRYTGNKEKLTYKQNITYDAKGNKLVESGYDGLSSYNNTFIYDATNRLVEIRYTSDKVLTEKRTIKYTGNITEMTVSNANNSILSKETTTFDMKKNVLEEVKYIQDNVSQKSNYAYDPNGKKVEETKQNFGNFSYRRKYSYDAKGNVLKISEEKPAGKIYDAYIYKYDALGNVIEERWAKDGSSEYSVKSHKYDSKGLLIESNCYFATYKFSVLYKFTYEFY